MSNPAVDSPGKKLRDRRLQKQMSVAEAARLTHIRPDRIVDLEKDDYSNFPSLAYARGFLLIYGRLLDVDVAEAAAKLENSNPVDIEEYEYLSGRPAPLSRTKGAGRKAVAIIVAVISIFFAGTVFVVHIINYANRVGALDQLAQKQQPQEAAASPQATPVPQPQPAPSVTPEPEVRRAEAVVPGQEPAAANDEIVLHPVKKAWVKIQKGSETSPPIYEDWLYPDANGLTLRGGKFWIQVSDGAAVEILKNGQPVPYNSPGIVVE